MARKRKDTLVIHRPLGKERALGIAHIGDNKIEIDPRLEGKKYMEIYLHELLHLCNPTFSETKILKDSKFITKAMWKGGFRWADLKK